MFCVGNQGVKLGEINKTFKHLFEYLWRVHIKRSGDDLFTSFLQLIAKDQRLVAETDEDNKVILII